MKDMYRGNLPGCWEYIAGRCGRRAVSSTGQAGSDELGRC